ncbi:hypothetical protein EVAR_98872_1 [Eumeta japonica]|uniref:Uncharacterized protein n=1 Tax=Eumeta variegata TaxID=151549 RepID=A0A4C1ZA84_EUMVA|nr:hypothetical protein EVAR_98872_1 [Eumeta japonica]
MSTSPTPPRHAEGPHPRLQPGPTPSCRGTLRSQSFAKAELPASSQRHAQRQAQLRQVVRGHHPCLQHTSAISSRPMCLSSHESRGLYLPVRHGRVKTIEAQNSVGDDEKRRSHSSRHRASIRIAPHRRPRSPAHRGQQYRVHRYQNDHNT